MKCDESLVTPTEENFDLFMANSQGGLGLTTDHENDDDDATTEAKDPKPAESDKDSDYGGSECGGGEATTLRMLLERVNGCSEAELAVCCQETGVLARGRECTSCRNGCMRLRTDGGTALWLCETCSVQESLRTGSWFQCLPPHHRLRDVILALYTWSRDYPPSLAAHEADIDPGVVVEVYERCQSLCSDYFRDEMSSIGGVGQTVVVETTSGIGRSDLIGGVETADDRTLFLEPIRHPMTRDDAVSLLADSVANGSKIHCHSNLLHQTIAPIGIKYLWEVWGLDYEMCRAESSDCSAGGDRSKLWSEGKKHLVEPSPYRSLKEWCVRRRAEASRDPFLFTLALIAALHPPR